MFAASGASLGLAFLVKESAVQWAPLAFVAWLALPSLRNRRAAAGALVFAAAMVAVISPWLAWAYMHTSELYMVGEPGGRAWAFVACIALTAAGFAASLAAWPLVPAEARRRIERLALPLAGAVVLAWGAFLVYSLTRFSGWPYPNDYVRTIPSYVRHVAPLAQPFVLLAASCAWMVGRALRGDEDARLLSCAAALFAPFAIFMANRNLQLRDALPLVYLAYVALGIAGAWAFGQVLRRIGQPVTETVMVAVLVLAGGLFALHQAVTFRDENDAASAIDVRADSWDSSFVRETGAWMEANLPAGAHVLSSRLYFSSLYVETGGRFEIRQMPTVRIDVDPRQDGLLVPRTNLFRWGDRELRSYRSGDDWLYVRQFPEKRYWVALSQQELLEYIAAYGIDYVMLTGDDVAFSSLSYASYFGGHPAFALTHHKRVSAVDQLFVYKVDRARLAPRPHSTSISPASADALRNAAGLDSDGVERALGTDVRVTDLEYGLSDREYAAALVGVELAAP